MALIENHGSPNPVPLLEFTSFFLGLAPLHHGAESLIIGPIRGMFTRPEIGGAHVQAEHLIQNYEFELVNIFCLPSSTQFNAIVVLEQDVSKVLPYLNATLRRSNYNPEARVLDFIHRGHIITIEPHQMKVTGLEGKDQADRVISALVKQINETWQKRNTLRPLHHAIRPATPLDILRHLPKSNCGECGQPTCLAFSLHLVNEELTIADCPELEKPAWADQATKLKDLLTKGRDLGATG